SQPGNIEILRGNGQEHLQWRGESERPAKIIFSGAAVIRTEMGVYIDKFHPGDMLHTAELSHGCGVIKHGRGVVCLSRKRVTLAYGRRILKRVAKTVCRSQTWKQQREEYDKYHEKLSSQ